MIRSHEVFIHGMSENSPCTNGTEVSLTSTEQDVFITEDPAFTERMRKNDLVPVYKVMKALKVKCRLDRDRLVVGDHVLCSGSAARAPLQQQCGTEVDHARASDVSAGSASTPP